MKSQTQTLSELKDSITAGELVIVTGTGVSLSLSDAPERDISWKGLIRSGFEEALSRGTISPEQRDRWMSQLDSDDIDETLSAAEFMGRKLEAPNSILYKRWMHSVFQGIKPQNNDMASALRGLASTGIRFATLNYDTLLEQAISQASIDVTDTRSFIGWAQNQQSGCLHLHGIWDKPESCILGIRDYESILENDQRNLAQRFLSSFHKLLFIGCGDTFKDPNFTNLIRWLRSEMGAAIPLHHALVIDKDVNARLADAAWMNFVDPISYGKAHTDLPGFLLSLAKLVEKEAIQIGGTTRGATDYSETIENYKTFIVRDCGQMTIEGIKADLDTAQRKFDIERLFVPLKVSACPPHFAANDPEREDKLHTWISENPPSSFGTALKKHKRIALLALPGAGKSLLLKRLAVAYSTPSRRSVGGDKLPFLNVIPVLIRCREWREHITSPIASLLSRMHEICGESSLMNLSDALTPELRAGRVLLLVDGLDEIHDDADRQTFTENLERFIEQYPDIRTVITSREAGFDLVAPSIARFCERLRLSPLSSDAIRLLSSHWHSLMTGDSPESAAEAERVTASLLRSPALRRLSENPLLLTMLLVVKHGAGRLPPDRATLYERAVEVLLDTWNIRGHDPLNIKEAIPQLSFIAYEMMRNGAQTATEKELLSILERARDSVPHIRRYARGTPQEFLKRVELRSSLLLEAGHQSEGRKIVPIYQFRHLTFQEYLTAVAASEGYYLGYTEDTSILDAVKSHIFSKEWQEVIPMAAVLGRKHSDTLLKEILKKARKDKKSRDTTIKQEGNYERPLDRPHSVDLLIQCLVEEVEVTPRTLRAILDIVPSFGAGGRPADQWLALVNGPFGEDLIKHCLNSFKISDWEIDGGWIRNTLGSLYAFKCGLDTCFSLEGSQAIATLLRDPYDGQQIEGLLTIVGALWQERERSFPEEMYDELMTLTELHIFSDSELLQTCALAAWAFLRRAHSEVENISENVLNRIFLLLVTTQHTGVRDTAEFSISIVRAPREAWSLQMDAEVSLRIQDSVSTRPDLGERPYKRIAALSAIYYGHLLSDETILKMLTRLPHERDFENWLKGRLRVSKARKRGKQVGTREILARTR